MSDAQPHQLRIEIDIPDSESLDDRLHRAYDRLVEQLGTPPACRPDHGVHVYVNYRGTGPCQCKGER